MATYVPPGIGFHQPEMKQTESYFERLDWKDEEKYFGLMKDPSRYPTVALPENQRAEEAKSAEKNKEQKFRNTTIAKMVEKNRKRAEQGFNPSEVRRRMALRSSMFKNASELKHILDNEKRLSRAIRGDLSDI